MSEESENKFLSSRITQAVLGLPVKLPNRPFAVPEDIAYAEFYIMGGDPIVIGGEGAGKVRVRYVSMIQLCIYVPEGKGTLFIKQTGDRLKDLFQFKQGRDKEGDLYRFKALQRITPSTTAAGWATTIYRIAYTREAVEAISTGIDMDDSI